MKPLFAKPIQAPILAAIVALFLATANNLPFWRTFVHAAGGWSIAQLPLILGTLLILVLFFNACLVLTSFRYLSKPLLIALLLVAAGLGHFMHSYGIVIDREMVQNVAETDLREATELLNWQLLLRLAVVGGIPALLIARIELTFPRGFKGVLERAGIAGASLLGAGVLLALLFKTLAPAVHEHRELRLLLVPTNLFQAVHGYLRNQFSTPQTLAPLGRDASKGAHWRASKRRTLTVIVLGETARAANFSLNGYARNTNPRLAREAGLINFSQVHSCGTATAVSVPCMFSVLGREHYDQSAASARENLLDVLSHAGLGVLWRDNNSGCKGVCARVPFEDVATPVKGDPLCNDSECYDERLLAGLPELMRNNSNDMVLVLHQKGSHGPAYSQRYPARFAQFSPACTSIQFSQCSQASIQAAYDNTILYTDHVLSQAIDQLRTMAADDGIDTALFYVSDHGESLGENNVYLHGSPYIFAPDQQTHVPMMLWLSESFAQRFGINTTCLMAQRQQTLSHDNFFHSILGMLDINTAVRNPRLDMFHSCIKA